MIPKHSILGWESEWAAINLPENANLLKKLEEELGDLINAPDDPLEMADVLLSLMLHADRRGVNLLDAGKRKLKNVRTRKYGEADANRVCHHIPDSALKQN